MVTTWDLNFLKTLKVVCILPWERICLDDAAACPTVSDTLHLNLDVYTVRNYVYEEISVISFFDVYKTFSFCDLYIFYISDLLEVFGIY